MALVTAAEQRGSKTINSTVILFAASQLLNLTLSFAAFQVERGLWEGIKSSSRMEVLSITVLRGSRIALVLKL